MDALDIEEKNTCDHASKYPGKCMPVVSDGHTAMLFERLNI